MGHRRPPADAGRDQGARAVRQRRHPPRRLLHAERVGGRLVADRHADARGGDRQAARLQVFANTEVLDIEVDDGAVQRRRHRQGPHRGRARRRSPAACGARASRAMAGATIPLTPGRAPDGRRRADRHAGSRPTRRSPTRSSATWTRSATSARRAGSMEVGSYAHRPIFHHPDDIPSNEASALSPTELPFTADDFDQQMEEAIDLMEMLGDAEIKYAINGLLSLTPDAMPVLGETVEVRNLWSAAAVWIKEGPGIAQLVAEWMTYGYPHLCDPHSSDISRFYPHERTEHHILRPLRRALQQDLRHRPPARAVGEPARHAPQPVLRPRGGARARCSSTPAAGSGRSGSSRTSTLVDRYPGRCETAPARVGRPVVVADHQRRAPPHARARRHGRPDGVQRVRLRAARRARLPAVHVREQRRRAGRPLGLHAAAHAARRLPRRPDDHAPRRRALPRDHRRLRRRPGQVLVHAGTCPPTDRSRSPTARPALCTIGVWGPERRGDDGEDRDRAVEAATTCRRPASRTARCATCSSTACRARCSASPTSARTAGRSTPTPSTACGVWDTIWEAGEEFGIRPIGIGVYAVTGRIEKGYRLMGAELESEYNPVEAGLARPKVKSADFIGKEAYLAARDAEPVATLCTLAMLDHAERRRHRPLPDGRQRADPHARRRAHRRRQGPRVAGDHGRRRAVARHVPAAGLPPARARGRGHRAAGDVHERAVPRARRPRRQPRRCSTPTTRG